MNGSSGTHSHAHKQIQVRGRVKALKLGWFRVVEHGGFRAVKLGRVLGRETWRV